MCQDAIEKMKYNCHDKFAKADPVVGSGAMPPNGPAIKGVCVAERTEAGWQFPSSGNIFSKAGGSEAWRGFWSHGTNLRAYTSVAVQMN